ncbi:MAG: 30S ribosomal protein S4, partial [Chloroflexota bacterium]
RYFKRAQQQTGLTGNNLLILLESRLDNVIYRLGIGSSRAQARQLVQHGHVMLNGRKTNIPSALVSPGDVISIRPESGRKTYFKNLRQEFDDRHVPRWLAVNPSDLSARVVALPTREDIDTTLNEQLVVEYYSR